MAAVSLFWDTNMAAVTSCENTLFATLEAKKREVGVNSRKDIWNRQGDREKNGPIDDPRVSINNPRSLCESLLGPVSL